MRAAGAALAVVAGLLTACAAGEGPGVERSLTSLPPPATSPASPAPGPADPVVEPAVAPVSAVATDGRPRPARLSIPALGLTGLRVQPYVGTPDDGPGTAIQDAGSAASPHGSGGLVGPGGLGNYLVTGHRTSSTQPFADLPSLRRGDRVVVVVGRERLVYEIVRTRSTSFRSAASLRAQSAAIPGRPDARPTSAMITLSTCATPEDHAAGNYWSDEFHNPEHRIDKIGVLRSIAPA